MAKSNDPLIESLMQMAAAAAPLIRKARESGLFRERDPVVDAEVVPPAAPTAPEAPKASAQPSPPPSPPPSPDATALHDIIVRQALRINELEAQMAAMKAAAAHTAAKPKAKPKLKTRARAASAD